MSGGISLSTSGGMGRLTFLTSWSAGTKDFEVSGGWPCGAGEGLALSLIWEHPDRKIQSRPFLGHRVCPAPPCANHAKLQYRRRSETYYTGDFGHGCSKRSPRQLETMTIRRENLF
jgi:hypothetical protein